jgi:hypothetical protein
MSTETHEKAFWEEKNTSFLTATPDCDLLHPEFKDLNPSPSLTETQFFGFSVPEENIHALTYLWHHPNLGVVSGGAWVWQGIKSHLLQSELFGWTHFMSDDVLTNDLWEYKFDNGYHVQSIEPLKKHRLRYIDEARSNSFDIEVEALMEPMLLQTGMHFEQAVRARGELTLRGKTYQVDCTHVRDRSWGQSRSEAHAPTPPIDWMTGVFNDNLMFGCTAYDDPDLDPDWKGHLQVPGGDPTKGGWVRRDGELIPIVATRKRVHGRDGDDRCDGSRLRDSRRSRFGLPHPHVADDGHLDLLGAVGMRRPGLLRRPAAGAVARLHPTVPRVHVMPSTTF